MGGAILGFSSLITYADSTMKIIWLSAALTWGTIRVYFDRSPYQVDGERILLSDENLWGFGQVFPLSLVALPLLGLFDSIQGRSLSLCLLSDNDEAWED